jgi:hypothetical protein
MNSRHKRIFMKRLFILLICFAFAVWLRSGEKFIIPDSVGFMIGEIEGVEYHAFFDKDGNLIVPIPSKEIKGVKWVEEAVKL